ncbi:MAG TPA: TIGR04282 family arsenosugar biosynthesis glycosyltransferase [Gammaproteobacteria bacterium]
MNLHYPQGRILVFAKAPVPGEVKTRLQPRLSMQQCAQLQQRLIEHTLHTCVDSGLCAVELWCAGDSAHPFFRDCLQRYPVDLQVQHGDDLGTRMLNALERTLQHAKFVLIVGTDCPALQAEHLRAAAETLGAKMRDHVLFIPAEDGGYVLLGASCAPPELNSNIVWSSGDVMARTRRNLVAADIDFTELDPLWDVDRPEDLARLKTFPHLIETTT